MASMSNKSTSHSPLFHTKDDRLEEIWDLLQRYQSDFCIAQELPHYYTFEQWIEARTVIDVGTGNGYYLNRIADLFPGKTYVGIDHSAELLAIASQHIQREQISFLKQDLWELTGIYDFAILRLVLQHVPDVAGVLECLARVVRPGGAMLVIDAHDPLRFFSPPVPKFMEFFSTFRSQEQQSGPDKTVTSGLEALVSSHPDWQVEKSITLTIPSSIPGNMELFRKTYGLVIDMADLVGKLDCEFELVKEEWKRWCSLEKAYAQVGLDVIRLVRV